MKVVFNADDFGSTETANAAIVYGFDNHYLDRTSIMVNMPYFEQAVKLAESHCFKEKVGLHINLISGEPLSEPIKSVKTFCAADGKFNGKIFKDRRLMLFLLPKERMAVRAEVEAQIERYIRNGFTLMHADSHGHVHTFPSFQSVVLKTVSVAGFKSIRISANLHSKGLRNQLKHIQNKKLKCFNRKHENNMEYFDSLTKVVDNSKGLKNKSGICEVMLHPNIWDGDMQIGEGLHYFDLDKLKAREGL